MILSVLAAGLLAAATQASMEDRKQTGPPVAAGSAPAKQAPPAPTPLPSVEAGGVKVSYRPLPWQPRMFAVAEGGDAAAAAGPVVVAGRPVPIGSYRFDFAIALMEAQVPLTLEGVRLVPGSYVFVIRPSRDGLEMRLQVRKVAPGTKLHRGQLGELPVGEVVSEGPAGWEPRREPSPQLKASLVTVAGGLRLILDYGDRRLSRDLKL